MKYLLIILMLAMSVVSMAVHAEPGTVVQRATKLHHANAKVKLTKQASGVVACMIALDDVLAGERIEFRGTVFVTNNNRDETGVTVEVMRWNPRAKKWGNMRMPEDHPDGTVLGGGNITLDMHHWPYTTYTDYTTPQYEQRQWFAVLIYAYRKPDPYGYLTLNGCDLRAERDRP